MGSLLAVFFTGFIIANAQDASTIPMAPPTNCYSFQVVDGPEAEGENEVRTETWCYQRVPDQPGATYIYNADEGVVRPELAILLGADGTITHGSLHEGEVSMHRSQIDQFNPFPIPLNEPKNKEVLAFGRTPTITASAKEVLGLLQKKIENKPAIARMSEASISASAAKLPWRGFWWPYLGNYMQGPLKKYDRYVFSRTSANPGSSAWEATNHAYRGLWWAGHCNGWAASSVLRKQPTSVRRDSRSGTFFTVADQKGLLAEKDYCSHVAFFGRRFNGRPGDNIKDIDPALFHRTLLYYIGQLRKPVAMDYRRDAPVDNHIISGYKMDFKSLGGGRFKVTAKLTVHKYDSSRVYGPGIAPRYTKTYRYILEEDSGGSIVKGIWLSDNPDFLWVPLSPANCSRNNQRITGAWVNEILNLSSNLE